jgi:ABC-type bacteriocin/lantibiotic exporter with double-glycine peptidase domain
MGYVPETVRGKLFALVLSVAVVLVAMWSTVALSGPLVWIALAIVALTTFTLVARYAWRRRAETALERAWVGAFSFGDVVGRMRAKEALQVAAHAG